MLYPGKARRER